VTSRNRKRSPVNINLVFMPVNAHPFPRERHSHQFHPRSPLARIHSPRSHLSSLVPLRSPAHIRSCNMHCGASLDTHLIRVITSCIISCRSSSHRQLWSHVPRVLRPNDFNIAIAAARFGWLWCSIIMFLLFFFFLHNCMG